MSRCSKLQAITLATSGAVCHRASDWRVSDCLLEAVAPVMQMEVVEGMPRYGLRLDDWLAD